MAATPRVIMYNGNRLPDFDPTKSMDEIKSFYAKDYPELTTAKAVMEIKEGTRTYEFKKAPETKG